MVIAWGKLGFLWPVGVELKFPSKTHTSTFCTEAGVNPDSGSCFIKNDKLLQKNNWWQDSELALLSPRADDLLWTHAFTNTRDGTYCHTEDMRSREVLKFSVLVTVTTWRHLECSVAMTVMMLSSLGLTASSQMFPVFKTFSHFSWFVALNTRKSSKNMTVKSNKQCAPTHSNNLQIKYSFKSVHYVV